MNRVRPFLYIRGGVSPGRAAPGMTPSKRGRRRRLKLGAAAAATLCALTAAGFSTPGTVFGAGGDDPAAQAVAPQGTLLAHLDWGSGPGQVGLQAPHEGLARGPEAVAVAPDGRIAVLDSVNRRLVLLDASGTFLRSVPLDLTEPRFLAVDSQELYVLDCDTDQLLASYDWQGLRLRVAALPVFTDVVTGLFATDAGPCVEVAHEQTFLIAGSTVLSPVATSASTGPRSRPTPSSVRHFQGRPVGPGLRHTASVSFRPGNGVRVKLNQVDERSLSATTKADFFPVLAPGRTVEHLVSVDGDARGGLIIGARVTRDGPTARGLTRTPTGPALVVTRLDWAQSSPLAPVETRDTDSAGLGAAGFADTLDVAAAGPSISAQLYLYDCPFAYQGQPYVVAPDGRVIQPVASEAGYSLIAYTFGNGSSPTTEVTQ